MNLNLNNLKSLTTEEIMASSFGIEWEGLRTTSNGHLSLTPHPKRFGDKLKNPIVTTDFSESQLEIITEAYDSVDEAFDMFSIISDLININLKKDEYIWFQSIPCILPKADKIPIAKYSIEGINSEIYRKELAKKYGFKKQMISGVHFNFSFKESSIEKLYELFGKNMTYKEFKDEIYLKLSRNYLRYCWIIIYLTGCSVGCHETFTKDCIKLTDCEDGYGGHYTTKGPSLRNSSIGYKNLIKLYPSYKNVLSFTDDLKSYLKKGVLIQAKELYAQIRLKPKDPQNMITSLINDGIQYVEIRTLDINPFYKCGLIKQDMKFLHIFLIYMLIKDESEYENWQEEAILNEENTAEKAYDSSMRLIKDGSEIILKDWALELINEMYIMCEELGIKKEKTLDLMYNRIKNPSLTYGQRLIKLVEKNGFINTHVELSKNNKKASKTFVETTDLSEIKEIKKMYYKCATCN